MSLFGEIFDNFARPLLQEQLGEAVEIYPGDGSQLRCIRAVVHRKAAPLTDGQSHEYRLHSAVLTTDADAATGFVEPIHDQTTVRFPETDGADDRWQFSQVLSRTAGSIEIEFHRYELLRTGNTPAHQL